MQPRESPHGGVPVSPSNRGETVSCVIPKNESGILQQKQRSVSESCESEADKVPAEVKNEQDTLNQRQSPDSGNPSMAYVGESEILDSGSHAAISNQVSVVPKKELSDGGHCASVSSKKALSGDENPASQFNQVLVLPKEEFDVKLIPETEIRTSQFNQVSVVAKIDPNDPDHGKNTDAEKNASVPNEGGGTNPTVLEKSLQHTPSTSLHVCTSLSDQERTAYSARPEKILHKLQPRRNPDNEIHTSQSAQGSNSPRIREKALDDGYNWRKYGQKLVKGNVFVRGYYKCTYSNCLVKKQVERSHDGQLTDIKYIGKHEHPKLQSTLQTTGIVSPPDVSKADMPLVATSEAKDYPPVAPCDTPQHIEPAETPRELTAAENSNSTGGAVARLHNSSDDIDNNSPSSKRQRKETCSIDDNQVQKTYCESRQVVMMMSEVDIVNDGYRWRKYGQKLVKGNPNPRSYYRCSNAGCKAKKHVERSSHDPKVVITTYEGEHDHDMPVSRTVGHSTAESGINRTTMNGEARSKLEESGINRTTMKGEARSELGEHKPVGMDMIVNIGAN